MNAQLIRLHKIWDRAPHNALTDLIRYGDRWLCAFREGTRHASPDGRIRLLGSADGIAWTPEALLEMPGVDLRDPKLSITPSGELLLNAAGAFSPPAAARHQSFTWTSSNGRDWSASRKIGEPDYWIWRVTWHKGIAFGVGYHTVQPLDTRLYSSPDGVHFSLLTPQFFAADFPNEASLTFHPDNTAHCLLRRDAGPATAQFGVSEPPYLHWSWMDTGVRIGGPNLYRLPDGRMIAAIRRYRPEEAWTSLSWIDPESGRLEEFLALPSGGDTSYAGLWFGENRLWVSYYSSHEERASIYMAQILLGE